MAMLSEGPEPQYPKFNPSRIAPPSSFFSLGSVFESRHKKQSHKRCKSGRNVPDHSPILHPIHRERVDDVPAKGGSDSQADTVCNQRNKSLRACSDLLRRLSVGVYLTGHEKEVVADSMQQNARIRHPPSPAKIPISEQRVANHPPKHPHQQRFFHPEPHQEPRHKHHKRDFGHLTQGLLPGSSLHAKIVEERVCETVVERKRNRYQQRTDHEDQK